MTAACTHCGEPVEAGERFCTHCGAEVPSSPPESAIASVETARSRWSRSAKATVAALAVGAVLASAAAVYLALELSATIDEREQAEAWLASTEGELDETKGRLRDSEALSTRRKVVLQQTGRVLTQVDPLLTSVDRMKAITNRMTETQASFAGNATSVISSLAILLDYVVDVDPLYWSLPYIYGLLADIRSGTSAASSDQSRFESLDRQYTSASKTFEQRATRYVRSVERLDGQLKKVAGS